MQTSLRVCSCLYLAAIAALGAAQVRVATYNISNYAGDMQPQIQTAMFSSFSGRSMKPDLLVCQEILSSTALNNLVSAMNAAPGSPGDYAAAPFVDGPDTDSGFVYRTSLFQLLATVTVAVGGNSPNHPRNIMRYDIRLKDYASDGGTLSLYSSHMKSGTTQSDIDRRLLEGQRIRANAATLPRPFLLGGDFNIQSSSDLAYVELVGSQANNQGRHFDPIATPGNWNNNASFRFVHTQDPIGPGGMDDRFDFILLSNGLIDGTGFDYIGNPSVPYSTTTWNDPNHSYRTWGNDGSSFNTALAVSSNTMVGPDISQALIDLARGAGHLPVFIDLKVPPEVDSPTIVDLGTVRQGSTHARLVPVSNAGLTSRWGANGVANLLYSLSTTGPFSAPGGQFSAAAGTTNRHLLVLDASTTGLKTGTMTVQSNAPDEPARVIQLRANVVRFSLGGGNGGGD
ncbi:MAG: hypothetical protein AB7F50_02230 [Fimbriimonadaceae bacterium]